MEATARVKTPNISQNESQPSLYAPISQQASTLLNGKKTEYHLKRYLWRSLLTIAGPLLVLAFYTFICLHFLARPLSNNVSPSSVVDATWVYFFWFLISVLILDWARTGLANIEASALMMPRLAPLTARELMWHADTNWANPLWWLRALRTMIWKRFPRVKPRSRAHVSMPGDLWMLLSLVHLLLFVAIPLSGLSMEVTDASTYAFRMARIYGPSASSFNSRLWLDLPQGIRRNWESGRQTSPSRGTLLYAPDGSRNVSTTYFDDKAVEAARKSDGTEIGIFAGPAVREPIWGKAWGLSTNVSCKPTPLDQLQMIRSDAYNTSVKVCSTQNGCEFQWLSNKEATRLNEGEESYLNVPVWLNESRSREASSGLQAFSLLAAADGWSSMFLDYSSNASISPYNRVSNHDDWTHDHIVNGAALENATTSMFEMILWQAGASFAGVVDDEIFKDYTNHPSPLVTPHNGSINALADLDVDEGPFVGFGVHCDIKSAVGTASLDPDKRTFSSFTRGKAGPSDLDFWFPVDIAPLQIQAMASLAGNQHWGNLNRSLSGRQYLDEATSLSDSTLAALHRAIGSTMAQRPEVPFLHYPTMTTENLTLALYKLLGESAIGLMGEGGVNSWTDPAIRTLKPATYLRSGAVPWQLVLFLLAIWAISTSSTALYTAVVTGPRWAPTLSGFELFKFGAQFQDEVHQFEHIDFQRCTGSLTAIPGMIGMLPGSTSAHHGNPGFIGLSDTVVDKRQEARYTLDREKAAKGRLS